MYTDDTIGCILDWNCTHKGIYVVLNHSLLHKNYLSYKIVDIDTEIDNIMNLTELAMKLVVTFDNTASVR